MNDFIDILITIILVIAIVALLCSCAVLIRLTLSMFGIIPFPML